MGIRLHFPVAFDIGRDHTLNPGQPLVEVNKPQMGHRGSATCGWFSNGVRFGVWPLDMLIIHNFLQLASMMAIHTPI